MKSNRIRFILILTGLLLSGLIFLPDGSDSAARIAKPEKSEPLSTSLLRTKVVADDRDTFSAQFINTYQLYEQGWDTLAQPKFWKQVINLPPDSCIINIARSRTPLETACYSSWCQLNELEKASTKDQLRAAYCVDYNEELYVTSGKREFYEHRKSLPVISEAIHHFQDFGCDPWYAQTILLIESPGKNRAKSSVGANGPFQLMRSVAQMYGLKVNRYVDERSDLRRSAYAASRLINEICIPKVKGMLEGRNIAYQTQDTWFRLLVLHAYHAGAGNLACAIQTLNPAEGGIPLITGLWRTECGGFKNESQNYSQIALAALLNFDALLDAEGDTVFLSQGNRSYSLFNRSQNQSAAELQNVLYSYDRDLVEGIVSIDRFRKVNNDLRRELMQRFSAEYPEEPQAYIDTAGELFQKRRKDDGVDYLRMGIAHYPQLTPYADSLCQARRVDASFAQP